MSPRVAPVRAIRAIAVAVGVVLVVAGAAIAGVPASGAVAASDETAARRRAHAPSPPAEPTAIPSTTLPPTTVPPTTIPPTTLPPTTLPPTTAAPTTAPPTTVPPTTVPPAPAMTLEQRFQAVVPAAWRARLPVTVEVIPGSVSWGYPDRIQIAQNHLGSAELADVTLAHEFGHVIAFAFGTREFAGAAPAGWPSATANPAEHWADCVQQVWVGVARPSHGLPPCGGAQLEWTRRYLAVVPA